MLLTEHPRDYNDPYNRNKTVKYLLTDFSRSSVIVLYDCAKPTVPILLDGSSLVSLWGNLEILDFCSDTLGVLLLPLDFA